MLRLGIARTVYNTCKLLFLGLFLLGQRFESVDAALLPGKLISTTMSIRSFFDCVLTGCILEILLINHGIQLSYAVYCRAVGVGWCGR